MKRRVVLASSSPYRRRLLTRIGVDFDVRVPEVDERPSQFSGRAPEAIAVELAQKKAVAVACANDEVVIASDQVVAFEDTILGKAPTREAACAQLQRLAGAEHRLLTAVHVLFDAGRGARAWVDVTTMRMRSLSPASIARYVDRDQPFDCAGAYKFEAAGIALFESLQTEDPTAIEGLPLLRLIRVLGELGVEVP